MNQTARKKKADHKNDGVVSDAFQTGPLKSDQEIQAAARSNMYALMADVFRYPDEAFRNFVRKGELAEGLADIVSKLPFECAVSDQEKKALTFPETLSDNDVEAEFIRLFESGPGTPPCPLIEGQYNKESNRRSIFEDLIRFYNNFGLSYQEGPQDDRPDHVSFELEFMHYLAFLALKAMQENKKAHVYLMAQKDFLAHHLAKWISGLVEQIKGIVREIATPDAVVLFYSALINILDHFITADFAYLKRTLAD